MLLLFARPRTRFLRSLIIGAVCGFVPYLFFVWNGASQFGSRYVSDLFPFLIPLAFSALTGVRRSKPAWRVGALFLVAVSVFENAFVALLARAGFLWQ